MYSALQETVIPAGFNPLVTLSYHILHAEEWTRSLGWIVNEWNVYFKIGSYFLALDNLFIICKLTPVFLALPNFQVLVFCLDGAFNTFWELARIVPCSSMDSVPTRDEQQMLYIADYIIILVDELCNITDTSRFETL